MLMCLQQVFVDTDCSVTRSALLSFSSLALISNLDALWLSSVSSVWLKGREPQKRRSLKSSLARETGLARCLVRLVYANPPWPWGFDPDGPRLFRRTRENQIGNGSGT